MEHFTISLKDCSPNLPPYLSSTSEFSRHLTSNLPFLYPVVLTRERGSELLQFSWQNFNCIPESAILSLSVCNFLFTFSLEIRQFIKQFYISLVISVVNLISSKRPCPPTLQVAFNRYSEVRLGFVHCNSFFYFLLVWCLESTFKQPGNPTSLLMSIVEATKRYLHKVAQPVDSQDVQDCASALEDASKSLSQSSRGLVCISLLCVLYFSLVSI